MAAVLVFSINTGHLALHQQRRPAGAALHATDRLVERAVAVVVLMPVEGMNLEAAINHLNKLDRQRRMKVGREIYLNKQSHARRDGDGPTTSPAR